MQTVIEVDPSGEYFITIPDEILESLGWKEGDEIHISIDGDKIILEKKNDNGSI
jgi:AbrB family looped-hinge helix DNA binding protein